MKYIGKYVNGSGIASEVLKTEERKNLIHKHFNCDVYGTFNIKVYGLDAYKIKPHIVDGIHKFYLIKVETDNDHEYGWAYKWDGSKMPKDVIELYFKKYLSDDFKTKPLKITICDKWDQEQIDQWSIGKYWFQSFDWASRKIKRADSNMLWEHMKNEDYSNKTVLDFGCNYGFFSIKASKAGAIVTGLDMKETDYAMFETINNNIELSDVKYVIDNKYPDESFDYIFELSVYHWMDETYDKLEEHINMLKDKCKVLYIELINPPLKGRLKKEDVDKIVGGKELVHYKHPVRRTRSLYKIIGNIK